MTWPPKLTRVATRKGKVVHWQNGLGPWLGQSGTWEFPSEEEAQRFADYASSDGAPPLGVEAMAKLGFTYEEVKT